MKRFLPVVMDGFGDWCELPGENGGGWGVELLRVNLYSGRWGVLAIWFPFVALET